MSAPELHADDLLDKDARGQLSPEERTRLESHLLVCSVCRFERKARDAFRAEFEAEARRDRDFPVGLGEPGNLLTGRSFPLQRPRPSRSGRSLLLVATLLIAGVAAAELARIQGQQASVPAAPNTMSSAVRRHAKVDVEAGRVTSDLGSSAAPVASDPEAIATARKLIPAIAEKPVVTAHRVSNGASPVAASFPTPEEPPGSAGGGVEAPPTAAALFAQANQLREHGAYDEAVRSYTNLIDAYPREPEALSANVMLGRLLLDRGQPQAALAHFDAYLRGGAGTLGEEAQLGRALALRKVGRTADEIEAWKALLAAHPDSVHAVRARERLAELGAQ